MPLFEARKIQAFACPLILWVAICIATEARAAEMVRWYSTVDDASAQAVPANRPIMIDFWATWCVPCKTMDQQVYSTAEFRQAAQRFLAVKIDYDKKTSVARKYNVSTLPTIVFADSYGNEFFRHEGFLDAGPLLALLDALPGDVTEFNRLNGILAQDKNNFAALDAMGQRLQQAGLFRTSNDYYERAARESEAKLNPEVLETIFNQIGLNYLAVRDSKLASQWFENCLKTFANSPRRLSWMLNLSQAYAFGQDKDKRKARKILQTLIQTDPSSPESEKARRMLSTL